MNNSSTNFDQAVEIKKASQRAAAFERSEPDAPADGALVWMPVGCEWLTGAIKDVGKYEVYVHVGGQCFGRSIDLADIRIVTDAERAEWKKIEIECALNRCAKKIAFCERAVSGDVSLPAFVKRSEEKTAKYVARHAAALRQAKAKEAALRAELLALQA